MCPSEESPESAALADLVAEWNRRLRISAASGNLAVNNQPVWKQITDGEARLLPRSIVTDIASTTDCDEIITPTEANRQVFDNLGLSTN
jgi:hypothetical protein